MSFTSVNLDAPDAQALGAFYRDLLGYDTLADEPGWVQLAPHGGGTRLNFQSEDRFVPPVWPAADGAQQMQAHLEIEVDDLDVASAYAVSLGATVADFQPQEGVRVPVDPAGHPFCLFLPGW